MKNERIVKHSALSNGVNGMLYYFIALCAAATVLLIVDRGNRINRWAAFFLYMSSLGGMTGLLADYNIPYLLKIVSLANQTLSPYGVLMFSIVYSSFELPKPVMLRISLLLIVPVMITIGLTIIGIDKQWNEIILSIWAVIYYTASCAILIRAAWKEKNARLRRNRIMTTLMMVPTLLAVAVLIHIVYVFNPQFDFFSWIAVFIILSFGIALLSAFVYGVLGIKLRIEYDPMQETMRAVSSGAALLNHSVKNDAAKIMISTENLKREAQLSEEALLHVQLIEASSAHLQSMVSRIHERTKDIVIHNELVRLDNLADEQLEQLKGVLADSNISVYTDYCSDPIANCDPVHVREAIYNLVMNAAEAMKGGGCIRICIAREDGKLSLAVQDNGPGIPKELLSRVADPFFSTKSSADNYGLGLSYIYNVMRKSGGKLQWSSETGKGARFELIFKI